MSVRKAVTLVFAMALVAAAAAFPQSNEIVDRVLEQEAIQAAEAIYLVQVASGAADEETSVDDLYQGFDWSALGLEQKPADAPVTLGEFSYFVMSSLDMSGGIMYSLIPGPRYAARELSYLGHIGEANTSPARTLPGNEALRILGSVLRADESS